MTIKQSLPESVLIGNERITLIEFKSAINKNDRQLINLVLEQIIVGDENRKNECFNFLVNALRITISQYLDKKFYFLSAETRADIFQSGLIFLWTNLKDCLDKYAEVPFKYWVINSV